MKKTEYLQLRHVITAEFKNHAKLFFFLTLISCVVSITVAAIWLSQPPQAADRALYQTMRILCFGLAIITSVCLGYYIKDRSIERKKMDCLDTLHECYDGKISMEASLSATIFNPIFKKNPWCLK